jgi:transposase-like protein
MPNWYPTALRERAVRAYEGSAETYAEVATRFSIHTNTSVRWVQRHRDRQTVLPAPRGEGWYSPVDLPLLQALLKEQPDRTTEELTRALQPARRARGAGPSVKRATRLDSGWDTSLKENARGPRNKTVR